MHDLNGVCPLCNNNSKIQLSHIIPSFIAKWLKKTSATGHFRNFKGERQQDVLKIKLLCKKCEQLFSKFERYFAETFFYRLIDHPYSNFSIEYNNKLIFFLISLSWRVLCYNIPKLKEINSKVPLNITNIYEEWKLFLVNPKKFHLTTSHYLFYWGNFQSIASNLYYGFEMYMYRGVDACYVSNSDKSIEYIYCKLPRFTIISLITPKSFAGFSDIEIKSKGTLKSKVHLNDYYGFINFINSRITEIQQHSISQTEVNKIFKSLKKNQDRFLYSDTLKASLSQIYRNNQITLFDSYNNFKCILQKPNRKDRNNEIMSFIANFIIVFGTTEFKDPIRKLENINIDKRNDLEVIQKILFYFEQRLSN